MRLTITMLLAAVTVAHAQDIGNMPADFYPKPACITPDRKSIRGAPGVQDQAAMIAYNLKLKAFNQKVEAFNACMQDYDARSMRDQQHLLFAVNGAVADARGSAPPAPPPPGDGNLPADFYPKPSCVKPDRTALGTQPSPRDHKAMVAYNQRVTAYNSEVGAFNTCIQDYTDHAKADIAAIARTANASAAAQ